MGDLIERLHNVEAYLRFANRASVHADNVVEAADELSSLRERVEALKGAVLPCDVTVAPATVFRAGVKVSTLLDCIEDRRSVFAKPKTRTMTLEEVIEPFIATLPEFGTREEGEEWVKYGAPEMTKTIAKAIRSALGTDIGGGRG